MSQFKYELIYILDPASTSDEIQSVAAKIEQLVADAKGTILKKEEWGRRRLAYRIQRFREGHYMFFQVAIDSKTIDEITRNLRMIEKVMKFMVVKEEISHRKIKPPRKKTSRPPGSPESAPRSGPRPPQRSYTPPPATISAPTPAPAPAESVPSADAPAS